MERFQPVPTKKLIRHTGSGSWEGTAIGKHNGLRAFPERSYP